MLSTEKGEREETRLVGALARVLRVPDAQQARFGDLAQIGRVRACSGATTQLTPADNRIRGEGSSKENRAGPARTMEAANHTRDVSFGALPFATATQWSAGSSWTSHNSETKG